MRFNGRVMVWSAIALACGAAGLWFPRLTNPAGRDVVALPPNPKVLPVLASQPKPPFSEIVRLKGHTDAVLAVAISADAKRVVSGSNDGTAIVWDVGTRKLLHRLEGHAQGVTAVGFSADGARVMTASLDGTARVWDGTSGGLVAVLQGAHLKHVHGASISPDGTRVLTGSCDHTAVLWDVAAEKPLQTYKHNGECHTVAFSPDGKTFLTGCRPGANREFVKGENLRLYDTSTGAMLADFFVRAADAVAFTADGRSAMVTSMFDLYVLDLDSRKLKALRIPAASAPIAPFPDGKSIFAKLFRSPALFDVEHHQQIAELPAMKEDLRAMAVEPGGQWAVVAGGGRGDPWGYAQDEYHPATDCDVQIVPATERGIREARAAQSRARAPVSVAGVAATPGTDRLFAHFGDGSCVWWDTMSGGEVSRFATGNVGQVTHVAVAPDASRAALVSGRSRIGVYDRTGNRLAEVTLPNNHRILAAALGGDPRFVFAGGHLPLLVPNQKKPTVVPIEVHQIELASGRSVRTFAGPAASVSQLEVSPDGRMLAARLDGAYGGEAGVIAWDVETARQLWKWSPPDGTPPRAHLASMTFATDGRAVAFALEKTAVVVDGQTGKTLRQFSGYENAIRHVALDPDGKRIWAAAFVGDPVTAWDRVTGEQLRSVKLPVDGIAFRFNAGGHALLGVRDGKLIAQNLDP